MAVPLAAQGADGISRERKKTIGPVKDYPKTAKSCRICWLDCG